MFPGRAYWIVGATVFASVESLLAVAGRPALVVTSPVRSGLSETLSGHYSIQRKALAALAGALEGQPAATEFSVPIVGSRRTEWLRYDRVGHVLEYIQGGQVLQLVRVTPEALGLVVARQGGFLDLLALGASLRPR